MGVRCVTGVGCTKMCVRMVIMYQEIGNEMRNVTYQICTCRITCEDDVSRMDFQVTENMKEKQCGLLKLARIQRSWSQIYHEMSNLLD